MFDLNKAIGNWRMALAQSGACRASDLDELEGHLRDDVLRLKDTSLSDEEKFLVAAHRLGDPTSVAREFAKINQGDIWGYRLFWIAAGLLLYFLLDQLAGTASQVSAMIAAAYDYPQLVLALVHFTVKGLVLAGALGLIYLAVKGSPLCALFGSVMARVAIFGLSVGAVALLYFVRTCIVPLISTRILDMKRVGTMAIGTSYASFAWFAVLVVALAVAVIGLYPYRCNQVEE